MIICVRHRSVIGKYWATLQGLSLISGKLVDRRKYWLETWVTFVCFASIMFPARSNARFGDLCSVGVLISFPSGVHGASVRISDVLFHNLGLSSA